MGEASPWIVEAKAESFEKDVIERSRELPVVVDFWATWCQPCRLLAPLLEKLAGEYAGKFLLVKADTDKLPDIAASFGVQGIPAVYGLRDGQVLDYFVGVLPEQQLRTWLDRLLPSPAEQLVIEAQKLEAKEPAQAEAKYREAAELAPNMPEAQIGLARVALAQGRVDDARKILDELKQRGFLEPEAEKLQADLDLRTFRQETGDLGQVQAAAAANPNDLDLQLNLAEALAAAGKYQEALETALHLIQIDRGRFGETARKVMLDVFRVLPEDSPLISEYRRKLSTALY